MRPNRQIVPLRNFNPNEFICNCGKCNKSIDPELMVRLQAFIYVLEREFDCPVKCIISGPARCEDQNRLVYGGRFQPSYHMGMSRGSKVDTHGAAVDVTMSAYIRDSWTQIAKDRVAKLAIESKLFGGVGWKIYGPESKFVHFDLGPVRTF